MAQLTSRPDGKTFKQRLLKVPPVGQDADLARSCGLDRQTRLEADELRVLVKRDRTRFGYKAAVAGLALAA